MSQERKKECQTCEYDEDCDYRHYAYPECYNLREEEEEIEYYGSHSSGDYAFPDLIEAERDSEMDRKGRRTPSLSEEVIAQAIRNYCHVKGLEVWVSEGSAAKPGTLKAISHVDLRLASQNLAKAIVSALK